MGSLRVARRSPLKEPPLHNPGQSADRQVRDLIAEKVVLWIVMAVFGIVVALYEWVRWLAKTPPLPVAMTLMAAGVCGLAWWKVRKAIPVIRQYAKGRDGEIAVGQFLEDLRRDGYHVFHDIPSESGNVDHVLIGPGGIFVIETKTNSKPVGRESKVVYDGQAVTVDGHAPDRDPVAQVRAASGQIDNIMRRVLGRSLPLRPVLLYVRWFTQQPKGSDIWVLNEDSLAKWLRKAYTKLDADEARQAAAALEMYVRNYDRPRD